MNFLDIKEKHRINTYQVLDGELDFNKEAAYCIKGEGNIFQNLYLYYMTEFKLNNIAPDVVVLIKTSSSN